MKADIFRRLCFRRITGKGKCLKKRAERMKFYSDLIGNTYETVILLFRKVPNVAVKINLDMLELDVVSAESSI